MPIFQGILMQNKSRITHDGNHDLDRQSGAAERPRVTIALFAYDQKKHSHQVVKGALHFYVTFRTEGT